MKIGIIIVPGGYAIRRGRGGLIDYYHGVFSKYGFQLVPKVWRRREEAERELVNACRLSEELGV